MIELRRCVGVRGVEREICGVSYETSSTNEAREMTHPRAPVVLQSRQFSASSSTACSAH